MPISGGPISGGPISGGGSTAPVSVPVGMIPFRLLLLLPEGEGGLAYAAEVLLPKYPGSGTFNYAGMTGKFVRSGMTGEFDYAGLTGTLERRN